MIGSPQNSTDDDDAYRHRNMLPNHVDDGRWITDGSKHSASNHGTGHVGTGIGGALAGNSININMDVNQYNEQHGLITTMLNSYGGSRDSKSLMGKN
jgi:hypothetical protein